MEHPSYYFWIINCKLEKNYSLVLFESLIKIEVKYASNKSWSGRNLYIKCLKCFPLAIWQWLSGSLDFRSAFSTNCGQLYIFLSVNKRLNLVPSSFDDLGCPVLDKSLVWWLVSCHLTDLYTIDLTVAHFEWPILTIVFLSNSSYSHCLNI